MKDLRELFKNVLKDPKEILSKQKEVADEITKNIQESLKPLYEEDIDVQWNPETNSIALSFRENAWSKREVIPPFYLVKNNIYKKLKIPNKNFEKILKKYWQNKK